MIEALILLLTANGAPVLAHKVLGAHLDQPIDAGLVAPDGKPLLGHTKSWRGLFSAILASILVALLLGLEWQTGALFGTLTMAGDLISSFLKRRLGMPSSSQAPGLDQVPESLLPLVGCRTQLALVWSDVTWLVIIFWVLELLLSRILFRLHIRQHPW
jgi:CDP-2,3-bis-(O-geranylgeranyl)-sn-glycerol synthase